MDKTSSGWRDGYHLLRSNRRPDGRCVLGIRALSDLCWASKRDAVLVQRDGSQRGGSRYVGTCSCYSADYPWGAAERHGHGPAFAASPNLLGASTE